MQMYTHLLRCLEATLEEGKVIWIAEEGKESGEMLTAHSDEKQRRVM